ncbi:circularly permuted type 2 ATP-grasp protein [Solirubrobacter sp. CPCC 204708]|uniref:Circularly permuted type 2 ATP-grasp protein n=1 Tax=Solirubrobacter deserti TaxID=2282478 RepID=A0ABT4RRT2_9ACTN|nr:circularly permuted type 2 ATP-grasp protein [Solirubrobacter deserti]MBE2314832.1 circularly permuted type 2 ATP-grasp protein [Solirubrobacter deserti]MDA0141241.1 circularly permuted type 2 ATP-grasp protein [Solirubrobacter deserti]
MASMPADELLSAYPAVEGCYDEAFTQDGAVRAAYRAGLEAVLRAEPAELPGRVSRTLRRAGVRFSSVEGDLEFYVDPVPRVITASEWEPVKRGLAQRVRALNAFVADVYGEQRIVSEGVVPAWVLESADYFEPEMRGVRPPGNVWIGVAGLDLVRDCDGSWLVLEDNVRTPSGFAYLHATRRALLEHIDVPPDATPRPLDGEIDLLADTLRAVAPSSARGRRAPVAALLTDGERNSAYWEHGWLSRQLGIPLVEPHELEVREDDCVWLKPRGLREARRIDVLYRRTNADRVDSDLARMLLPAVRAGRLGLVNQYGTGVADDKLTHAYVEDMIRFYVEEEPILRSVPTYDLSQPAQLEEALDVFDQLVLKPRAGHGGVGVLIAPRSSPAEIEATRKAVLADPSAWIAQRMIMLSTHPTVVDGGGLAPRHIDLRPFVFLGEGCNPRVLPGGLTRVARSEGALVVNSSQNGGAKDTWVLP